MQQVQNASALSFPSIGIDGQLTRLRSFQSSDITPAYIGWLNDPAVVRFSNQRFYQHTAESSARYLADFGKTPNRFLSIARLADGHAIGTLTVYWSPQHGTADMGILIGEKSAWGHGFGLDAWLAAMSWLEAQPSLRKITCGTAEPNIGMRRVAEKAGMHLEARKIRQEIVDGKACDLLFYARFVNDSRN